jgi:hypothetical protein
MRSLRALAPKYKKRRFGITPMVSRSPRNARKDASTALKRAWIQGEEYTAPVEWVVSGNEVQAILLKGEGYGISIQHPEIAESFRQIMFLLFEKIRQHPDYKKLPKLSQRAVVD